MASPNQTELAVLIQRERLRAGLTIRQLAEAAGIATTTLFRIENGTTVTPKPEQLNRLARVLGIEVEEFYAAVGLLGLSGLPSLRPYLRTKYGVTEADAQRVEGYLQALRDGTNPSGEEGSDDRRAT